MVGYVLLDQTAPDLRDINQIFLGGDTRYGLGRLRGEGRWEPAADLFGFGVELSASDPVVHADRLLAHGYGGNGDKERLCGQREVLGGWSHGSGRVERNTSVLWTPGSVSDAARPWMIRAQGYWEVS
jgi:hypothetical protein